MAFLDERGLDDLWGCIDEKFGRIAIGSYVGTGTGSVTVALGFRAKLFVIFPGGQKEFAEGIEYKIYGNKYFNSNGVQASTYGDAQDLTVTFTDDTISWSAPTTIESTSAGTCTLDDYSELCNVSGTEYHYFAIG